MRTVADARDWAEGQWQRNWKRWLTTAEADAKSWPLHPPSQAQFAADPEAVARWTRSWRDLRVAGVEVEWVERHWPAYGRQLLPQRVVASPDAIAGLAGMRPSGDGRGRTLPGCAISGRALTSARRPDWPRGH